MTYLIAVLLCMGVSCVLGDSYGSGQLTGGLSAYSPSLWTSAGYSGLLGQSGSGYGLSAATGKGSLISSETVVRTPYYAHTPYAGYYGAGAGYSMGGAGFGSMGMQNRGEPFGLGPGIWIIILIVLYILFFNTSG